jgi:hypothetical protein
VVQAEDGAGVGGLGRGMTKKRGGSDEMGDD